MKALRRLISRTLLFFFTLKSSRWLLTGFFRSKKVTVGTRNTSIWFPDWITVDLKGSDINVDLNQHEKFPFEDESKSFLYSSHMIEHIPPDTLKFFLMESHRILEKGGIIRIEAPDTTKIIEAYKTGNHEFFRNMGGTGLYSHDHIQFISTISSYVVNNSAAPAIASKTEIDKNLAVMSDREFCSWAVSLQTPEQLDTHGHQNPVTYEIVRDLLNEVGFRNISRKANGESEIPGFRSGQRKLERPSRAYFSFYAEAYK